MNRYFLSLMVVAGLALTWAADLDAGGGKSDSKVKASVTATKPDADGKQTVTITLEIEKGFYLYANPVNNEFLESAELKVKIVAKEPAKVKMAYPPGKTRSF